MGKRDQCLISEREREIFKLREAANVYLSAGDYDHYDECLLAISKLQKQIFLEKGGVHGNGS